MQIRPYRQGDYEEVKALWIASGLSSPERDDDEKCILDSLAMGGCLLVMYDEQNSNIITGTSWMTFDGRRIHLHHFGIHPQYRRRGHARILLRHSLLFVKEKGYQVKIEVERENMAAINLYIKAGFKPLGNYDVFIIRKPYDIDLLDIE